MINPNFINQIVYSIGEKEREYRVNQGLILSEDDLKCLIFKKIDELIRNRTIETSARGFSEVPSMQKFRSATKGGS